MWIARDKTGSLNLYSSRPIKRERCFVKASSEDYVANIWSGLLSEVTFDNSPVEVEIKIKTK